MRTIELTSIEADLLEKVVDRYLAELSYEIANTDLSSFKAQLKLEREVLQGMLGRIAPYAERAWS